MITLTELNQAVCEKVREALKAAEVEAVLSPEDLSEPIRRPSIKVVMEEGTSSRENSSMKRTAVTVRIYFFAKDRGRPKKENLQVREALSNAFLDEVEVGDYWIPILEDVEFTTTDGVLVTTVNLDYMEYLPEHPASEFESSQLMENLHMEQRMEE